MKVRTFVRALVDGSILETAPSSTAGQKSRHVIVLEKRPGLPRRILIQKCATAILGRVTGELRADWCVHDEVIRLTVGRNRRAPCLLSDLAPRAGESVRVERHVHRSRPVVTDAASYFNRNEIMLTGTRDRLFLDFNVVGNWLCGPLHLLRRADSLSRD